MFLQILAAPNDRHAILSVQAVLGAAIRTDRSRRAVCALERMSCGLAVLTIAHRTYDRRTNDLNGSLTALATGEATLLVFFHFPVSIQRAERLDCLVYFVKLVVLSGAV
jgi:hypothetical protein